MAGAGTEQRGICQHATNRARSSVSNPVVGVKDSSLTSRPPCRSTAVTSTVRRTAASSAPGRPSKP